jgi:two-component sensor histidine kinase
LIVVDDAKYDSSEDADDQRDIVENQPDTSVELVVGELQHRIRNLFAVVQCFVNQTESATAPEYRAALSARIANLADAYQLIERTRHHRISLADLFEKTLRPYVVASHPDRIYARGPDVELEPNLALSIHMVLHELATNAGKHGAFSTRRGRVEAYWELLPGLPGRTLAMQWKERGGPEVREPSRKGFGVRLITKVLAGSQVELNFDREGLVCRLLIPMDGVQTENVPQAIE